eukprot:1084710-Pyramimonas_sp.AAC.1
MNATWRKGRGGCTHGQAVAVTGGQKPGACKHASWSWSTCKSLGRQNNHTVLKEAGTDHQTHTDRVRESSDVTRKDQLTGDTWPGCGR